MRELVGYVQWNHLGMGKGSWNNHQPYQPTIQCLMEWVKQMMREIGIRVGPLFCNGVPIAVLK